MARIGLVGIGFMGWIHYLAYRRAADVSLGAVCTRDAKRLAGDWRGIQGNFGPPGEQVDLSGVAKYSRLEDLLADRSIDVVDLCLPPHLHAEAVTQALRAGKHVFCEKPLGLTAAECDAMVGEANKAGKQLLVGQVLPFFPEYAAALREIRSGAWGKPLGGHFKRVISDPLWLADFYDPRRVGGPLIDLHVHDAHFIRLVFGQPEAVLTQGRFRGEVVEHCQTFFRFADRSLNVAATAGVVRQQGRPFTHGFEIHLEKATLHYEFAALADRAELMPFKILAQDGQVTRPELGDGDPTRAFDAEIAAVVESLAAGRANPILSAELARDAVVLCERQTASAKTGEWTRV